MSQKNKVVKSATSYVEKLFCSSEEELIKASKLGCIEKVISFLNKKTSKKTITIALEEACREGHENIVKILLKWGKVKTRYSLAIASEKGFFGIVKLLVIYGVNINKKLKESDCTPVMYSAWAGNLEITKFLVQNGALLMAYSHKNKSYELKNAYEDYGFLSNLDEKTKEKHRQELKEILYTRFSKKCNMIETEN